MADIYRHAPHAPDEHVGRVNPDDGAVHAVVAWGPDQYLGRVDYASGRVYRQRNLAPDEYLGHAGHDGRIYAHRLGPDAYLGRVEPDGRLFRHVPRAQDEYLGQVRGMRHPAEGAAALFFFFAREDEGA